MTGAVGVSFNSWPCSGTFGSVSFFGPGLPLWSLTGFSSTDVTFVVDFPDRLEVVLVWLNLLLAALAVAFFCLSYSSVASWFLLSASQPRLHIIRPTHDLGPWKDPWRNLRALWPRPLEPLFLPMLVAFYSMGFSIVKFVKLLREIYPRLAGRQPICFLLDLLSFWLFLILLAF